jgi:hypothetical protein
MPTNNLICRHCDSKMKYTPTKYELIFECPNKLCDISYYYINESNILECLFGDIRYTIGFNYVDNKYWYHTTYFKDNIDYNYNRFLNKDKLEYLILLQ